jgi:erythromycin esterase-like protein/predicted phosphoribosyltransferase
MAFRDRIQAGQVLADKLSAYRGLPDAVVLGLPRGGVPVAEQVALALGVPLDVFVVRKLGLPGRPELAMGAIASGGVQVLNQEIVRLLGISDPTIEQVAAVEQRELARREKEYRAGRPPAELRAKTVIVVDDGLATGASMRAAVEALRLREVAGVVAAVPIGAVESCGELADVADDVVCAVTPEPFGGVGLWYEDFSQTTDEEVKACLARAALPVTAVPGGAASPPPIPRGWPSLEALADAVRAQAIVLRGERGDYQILLDRLAGARVVLIGEASHGTHEFYAERAELTKRLIQEKGFSAVAVEADWPDAYRVNRFVRGQTTDAEAVEALRGFARFPAWMWRNADVLDFVGWLREHNDGLPASAVKTGFYGLDLYSLYTSMQSVVDYLERVDPDAARRARERYACFEQTGDDGQQYGFAAGLGLTASCEQEVVNQLRDLRRHAAEFAGASPLGEDEYFYAERNAEVAKNAEEYYRSMFRGRVSSWNLRDRHMMETLDALMVHLERTAGTSKVVVWAHNSHLGDARATEMGEAGELNLGQLVREKHGAEAALIGLTTFDGTVTAASTWGGPAERKGVRPALGRSYEALFHAVGQPRFMVMLKDDNDAVRGLDTPRLERAIGVLYLPQTERVSHYFQAKLPQQFDAIIHIDRTRALEPLERSAQWARGELPETFPSAV